MKLLNAIIVATFFTTSCAVDAKPLVYRCKNPEAEYSMSSLVIYEKTKQITQTWDADGYSETNKGTFKNGGWSWQTVTDEAAGEAGFINDMRLDLRTGVVSTASEGGELEPSSEVCRLSQ